MHHPGENCGKIGLNVLLLIFVFLIGASGHGQSLRIAGMEGTFSINEVAVEGNIAYAATLDGQIQVYDISYDIPLLLSRTRTLGPVLDLKVQNGYLYAAESAGGLCIYDANIPERPARIFSMGREDFATQYDDPSEPFQVVSLDVAGDTLVVGYEFSLGELSTDCRFKVLNVSDPHNPILYDYHNGPSRNITIYGNYLFLGQKQYVYAFDISTPASPIFLTHVFLSYQQELHVNAMTIADDRLAVLAHNKVVILYDISDPGSLTDGGGERPDLLSNPNQENLAGYGNQLAIRTAFGVDLYEFPEGSDPAQVGSIQLPGIAGQMCITENEILAACGNAGLCKVTQQSTDPTRRLGRLETAFDCRGVLQMDDLAVLLGTEGDVQLVDITDPSLPTVLGSFQVDAENPEMTTWNDLLVIADGKSSVEFLDISDPASPVEVATYTPTTETGEALVPGKAAVSGNYLLVFAADFDGDITEVHVLGMDNGPKLLARHAQWEWKFDRNLRTPLVQDNQLILADADTDHISLIDISDPIHPGTFNQTPTSGSDFKSIYGNRIALSSQDYWGNRFVGFYDITDPAIPRCEHWSFILDMFFWDHYWMQLTEQTATMSVSGSFKRYRLMPDAKPSLTGSIPMPRVYDFTGESLVLAACGNFGLYLLHLPDTPRLVLSGTAGGSLSATSMEVTGNVGITAHHEDGVAVVSLLDPKQPAIIGRLDSGDSFHDVAVDESHAFVTGNTGLSVLDITQPSRPMKVAGVPTQEPESELLWIDRSDNLLATSTQTNLLSVLDISDPQTPGFTQHLRLDELSRDGSNRRISWIDNGIYSPGSSSSSLEIVDATDPAHLVEADGGAYGYPTPIHMIGQDGVAWIMGTDTLRKLDVSDMDAAFPVLEIIESLPSGPGFLSRQGSSLYGLSTSQILSFDIPETGPMALRDAVDLPFTANVLKYSGPYLDDYYNPWDHRTPLGAYRDIDSNEDIIACCFDSYHPLITAVPDHRMAKTWVPHIAWTPWWNSFLVVDNPGTASSEIAIHAFEDGSALPIEYRTVAAGEQAVIPLSQGDCGFVASDFADGNLIFREVFISHEDGVCEFLLDSQASPEISLSFPEIALDQLTWRGLAIMNVEDTPTNARLEAFDAFGQMVGETTIEINGRERSVGYLQDYFPGVHPETISHVTIIGGRHLTALRISGQSNSQLLFTPSVNNFEPVSGRYYLTHIATEWGQWENTLELNNRNGKDVDVRLVLFASSSVVLDDRITVPAGETIHWQLNQFAKLEAACGYLDILDDNIMVRQSYRNKVENGLAEFLLKPEASDNLEFLFPGYSNDELTWKGIALQNVTAVPDTVQVDAFGSGTQLASRSIEIDAHDRIAITLEELFPFVSGIDRIRVTGDRAFTGLNISGMGHERLLFIPAVAVSAE